MKIYQFIIVGTVFVLIVLGLNVSNHSVNDLTRVDQGDILTCERGEGGIVVEMLGKRYEYRRDRLTALNHQIGDQFMRSRQEVRSYMERYRAILDAVVNKGTGQP